MTDAYPLAWPDGWPRANDRLQDLPGGQRIKGTGWNQVVERLMRELRLLRATKIILSTNQPLRNDGMPYMAKRLIGDPGAAVYFQLKERNFVMAQDRYWRLHDNIRSLALAIEGLRQMQRHGGGHMMERAFQGFAALPAAKTWREVLGFGSDFLPTTGAVEQVYRNLAKQAHPDVGGSATRMAELNAAVGEARREIG